MSVTQNDVRNAYRFVLGREPESEEVIQFWAGRVNSWRELRQCFQDSEEYKLNNPARIAQASASHEDFYLKKCDGDFFWCLRSDGDDNVSQAIRATGRWGEATELKEVIKQLDENKKSGGVLLDLGANVGAISIPFAQDGWHAIAVEAGSRNVDALRITSKLDNLDIEVLPYIVHEKTGAMYFYQNGPWGFVTNDVVNTPDAEKLNAFKLDDLEKVAGHEVNRIDFVKMDVEGSEVAAVRGAERFFKRYGYPTFYCEANRWTLIMQNECVRSLKDEFAKHGYQPYIFMDGKFVHVLDPENQIENIVNYYFIHEGNSANGLISDNVLKVAGQNYVALVERYIENSGEGFDNTFKLPALMLIRKNPDLMASPKLHAYAEQIEAEMRKDAVMKQLMDQCLAPRA